MAGPRRETGGRVRIGSADLYRLLDMEELTPEQQGHFNQWTELRTVLATRRWMSDIESDMTAGFDLRQNLKEVIVNLIVLESYYRMPKYLLKPGQSPGEVEFVNTYLKHHKAATLLCEYYDRKPLSYLYDTWLSRGVVAPPLISR